MRVLRYVIADVFTDRPLTGNPVAVFTEASSLDAATMQALARELNLSETVFVLPPTAGGDLKIRIFTPQSEIPFAGHPTLGAAFVVGDSVQLDVLRLETGKGVIPVQLSREGARVVFGWMRQPLPTWTDFARTAELQDALGVDAAVLPAILYDNGPRHLLVGLKDAVTLSALRPDLNRLRDLHDQTVAVFALTAGNAAKLRVFAPGVGIPEDPATGSAAGPLAVHLLRHGALEPGVELLVSQGAEIGRPSQLHARVAEEGGSLTQVEVGGGGVIVARGEFRRF